MNIDASGLVQIVLIVSILLQLASAVYALLLIRQSGFLRPWLLVSASILLMAVRRIISFCQMSAAKDFPASALEPELVALVISILMLIGLLFLGPAFRMIRIQREVEVKKKDFLIRESHHNVKNNLQMLKGLISLQGISAPSPEIQETLKELELRIGSFLLLHEQVYADTGDGVSLRAYIHALVSAVVGAYSHMKVGMVLDIEDLYLPGRDLISCGVIVNEALTNSYKYAFSGSDDQQISITAGREGERGFLVIKDNGRGFSVKEKTGAGPGASFGLTLMQALGKNAGWNLEIDGSNGTIVKVSFPITA